MRDYRVFGDTGGHEQQLRAGLEAIGMEPSTLLLPESVTVVHCGDLIHKGPHSLAVLELVDAVMRANPGRWIQLLGNHEAQYFRGAPTFWPQVIDEQGQLILHSWRARGLLRNAYAVAAPLEVHGLSTAVDLDSRGVLFTHAGLTYEFWQSELGAEREPLALAALINELPLALVTQPGSMLSGHNHHYSPHVGPVWASAGRELWSSWLEREQVPFHQVHGHTGHYDFDFKRWWWKNRLVRLQSTLELDSRLGVTQLGDAWQFTVDPGFEEQATVALQPSLQLLAT